MTTILRPMLNLILVLAVVPLVLLFAADTSAGNGICHTEVTLSAPGSDGLVFQFESQDTLGNPFSFAIADGGSAGGNTPLGAIATITEAPQNGWVFGGIQCEAGTGVSINEIPGGFTIECLNLVDDQASCVITNVLIERNIPTLSEWGMIAAGAGLILVGVYFAVRWKRARAV